MELENKIELQNKKENIYHKCEKCGSSILMSIFYNKRIDNKGIIEINYPSIIYRCQNNHIFFNNKTLANTYYETIKEFSKKCSICKSKNNLFFCNECEKYFCFEHKKNDKCVIEHKLIKCCSKINFCEFHEKKFCYYCNDCLKGVCENCFVEHKFHNYIKLNENLCFSNDDIKKFENLIQECKNIIKNFEKKVNLCIKELNNVLKFFKNNNEIQIKLCENLLNVYKNSIENNIINYDIIKNINNVFNFNLSEIKFTKFKKNNVNSLILTIEKIFEYKNTNLLKNNYFNLISRTQINNLLKKYNNEINKYNYDIKFLYKNNNIFYYGEIHKKTKDYRIGFLFKNNGYEHFEGNIYDCYGKYKFKQQNFIGKINFERSDLSVIEIIKDGKGILYDNENKFTGEWKNNLKIK